MTLKPRDLNKSALSALLFLCVYHVVSLLMQGSFFVGFIFLGATIVSARTLINEQNNTHKTIHNNYAYALGCAWLAAFVLLFSDNNSISSIGVWFCILIIGTSILLKQSHSLKLNSITLIIFWAFAFLESAKTFILIESAIVLTIIFILSGIIQRIIYDLELRLTIAKDTDSLTGCIKSNAFIIELEKVVQLYERYETPFSLICIKYQSHFNTEAELQIWLKELSSMYQSRLRKTDVLCRFNTQKFMILLPSTNIKNAEALSLDLENCASAYEFSFKNEPSILSEPPSLNFTSETFTKNENIDDWFRKIQSQ